MLALLLTGLASAIIALGAVQLAKIVIKVIGFTVQKFLGFIEKKLFDMRG